MRLPPRALVCSSPAEPAASEETSETSVPNRAAVAALLIVVALLMISPALTAAAVLFDRLPFQQAESLFKTLARSYSYLNVGRVILTLILIPGVWRAVENPQHWPEKRELRGDFGLDGG
jgi:hypothetical protein